MDNNQYNNNGSKDSFYSYNNGNRGADSVQQNSSAQAGSTADQTQAGNHSCGGTYNNGYQRNVYQQNGYQQNGYQQNGTYQNGAYQGGMYQNHTFDQTAQANGKKPKKKKERKPGGFGTKLLKCAALALVFGLVAGAAFQGVNFASGQLLGTGKSSKNTTADNVLTQADNSKVESTSTSSTYVATDVSDIVDASMPSIVAITNVSETEYQSFFGGMPQKYESTSCGSGIIVSKDDNNLYIATNNHVVDGANSLTVTFNDKSTVSAEVKGTDPATDLAVIRVALDSIEDATMSNIKIATLGNSDDLRVGQACIAIGNALGYGQSVTTGCISALNREVSVSDSSSNTSYSAELIQTDAAINPGNSGGALLSANGEVIGINSVKYSDTSVEGIGYAIPMSKASPIIEDLITKEKVDENNSAYLGIAGVDVTSDVAKTYNMPTGVYVAQVTEGSAAQQAGIQSGDIISEFDGKTITSMQELSTTLEYYSAGTAVDVKIQRASNGQYQEQTISVTLGKKN